MTTRASLVSICLVMLGACSGEGGQGGATGGDRFAGLDGEIKGWRTEIETAREGCAKAAAGKGCVAFEVACKGELPIAPEEAAAGVTAKLVAAMTYSVWDPAGVEQKPASAFAQFAKTKSGWTHKETAPVNLATCAAS